MLKKITLSLFALGFSALGALAQNNPGVTTQGTVTPGNCAEFVTKYKIQDAGAPCGSGSGGVSSFNGRTGVVVPAINDYGFADLSGTISAAQMTGAAAGGVLSGTYPNPGMSAGAAATNIGALGGVLGGTLPNPSMAAGAAATNVGALGGALTGTLPNPSYASIASGRMIANDTAGAASPSNSGVTATSFFDRAYCSTVGYIIVRTTSIWTCSNQIQADPTWFGADNTGGVASQSVFNTMLNAGIRNISCYGTYLFTGTVNIPQASTVNIKGNCTVNVTTGVAFTYLRVTATSETYFTLDGVSINGVAGTTVGVRFQGISGLNNSYVYFRNARLTNHLRGLDLAYTAGTVENTVTAMGSCNCAAFYGTIDVSNFTFQNVTVLGGSNAILFNDSNGNTGLSNTVTLNNFHSVSVTGTDVSFTNYDAIYVFGGGFDLGGSGTGAGQAAFYCGGCTNLKIISTFATSLNTGPQANRKGLWIENGAHHLAFNVRAYNNAIGIHITGTADYWMMQNNDTVGSTSGIVNASSGSNTVSAGNL